MSEENDSWLEGIGVNVSGVLGQAVSDFRIPEALPPELNQPVQPPAQPNDGAAGGVTGNSGGAPFSGVGTGPNSNEAPPPAPPESDNEGLKETAIDILKSKGLVAVGELLAGKLGGIIGFAVDLATSPGGDTSLPHVVFQASRADDTPIPGAGFHRKRENAERDAQLHTLATGEATIVGESFSKASDDPE